MSKNGYEYLIEKSLPRGMQLLDPKNIIKGKHVKIQIPVTENIKDIIPSETSTAITITTEFGEYISTRLRLLSLRDYHKLKGKFNELNHEDDFFFFIKDFEYACKNIYG